MRKLPLAPMVLLLGLAGCTSSPAALLDEATGAVSQTLCSTRFVSGLPPDEVFREHLRPEPGMAAIEWALDYQVDPQNREVRASLFGGWKNRSRFSDGGGCTLIDPGATAPAALPPMPHGPTLLAEIAGPAVVMPADPRLRAALDAAFAEPASGPRRNTKAVVVLRHGQVIAERYAAGYGPDTALLSHSVAKSVVNALAGILVRDGALKVDEAAPITAWRSDARQGITIDNLLRMNPGFGFDEGSGASIASHIWYTQRDTAGASALAVARRPPGEAWGYCSRCYVLLSRIIGDRVGGGPAGLRDLAQRELFDPLGMHSVTLEFDASGTMMGANAMLATPRDWARLGLLYLHDGKVGDRRILPEGWVAYSTRPTGTAGYGAGFWLNTTSAAIPEWRMPWGLPGAPPDAFMARGYMGQYVVVVPSADLIVVRFGQSHGAGADAAGVGRLVREVIAAKGS